MTLKAFLIVLALASVPFGDAAAQTAPAPTPSYDYRSPLSDFRKFGPVDSVPWKDANETVEKVGGHMGVLQAPDIAPPSPAPAERK